MAVIVHFLLEGSIFRLLVRSENSIDLADLGFPGCFDLGHLVRARQGGILMDALYGGVECFDDRLDLLLLIRREAQFLGEESQLAFAMAPMVSASARLSAGNGWRRRGVLGLHDRA